MDELDRIEDALRRMTEVRLAYLFGSIAKGTGRPSSDLDIAVLLASPSDLNTLGRITAELEACSGRSVDLVDLSHAPPLLAHEIFTTGKLLVCRDEDERLRLVTRAVARYLDTAHLREVQHHYLRERVEARSAATH